MKMTRPHELERRLAAGLGPNERPKPAIDRRSDRWVPGFMTRILSENSLPAVVCFLLLLTITVGCRTAQLDQTAYNVRSFGAKGDGQTLDHRAINRAIAAAARSGGGTVVVPPGMYLCGSIHLQSNIHLCH